MSGKSLTIVTSAIAKDAELRFTPAGKSVCSFSLPVDIGWGDNKKTAWYKCALFGERAEKLAAYLIKGMLVCVTGELTADETGGPRVWTTQDGKYRASYELNIGDITLLGMRAKRADSSGGESDNSEIPF